MTQRDSRIGFMQLTLVHSSADDIAAVIGRNSLVGEEGDRQTPPSKLSSGA